MRVRAPFLPALLVLIAIVAVVPIVTNNPSLREELFLVFMLITLASSINIIMGYTGYVSFGHIVFFGIGGYIAFWLMQTFNVHFSPATVAGALPAALIAAAHRHHPSSVCAARISRSRPSASTKR